MRQVIFTFVLAVGFFMAPTSIAFEIEAEKHYPAFGATRTLNIISTTDISAFEPLVELFQNQHPDISIRYVVASSTELMKAIYEEKVEFDLALSSAMDLQTKFANDGLALSYSSSNTEQIPVWAKWRDQIFGFTREPTALVVSDKYFKEEHIPRSRHELIELLRAQPGLYGGKIGTYDVRKSGAGYLFATQDSRNTENFWSLTEVMGRLDAKLYCCSGDMLDDVAIGKLALAYNVLASYAETKAQESGSIHVVTFEDYVTIMVRTALIPKFANNPSDAGLMIDFLVSPFTQSVLQNMTGFPPIYLDDIPLPSSSRPIRLGPGLLVFLDKMRKEKFLRIWESSIEQ